MEPNNLNTLITQELAEIKAQDVLSLDVSEQTTIADYMVICTGRSERHVKAIYRHIHQTLKDKGITTIGTSSGDNNGDWIVVDYGSTVLHIMLAQVRAFYNLEGIWQSSASNIQRPANEN